MKMAEPSEKKNSSEVGRYLVSEKNFKAGERVFGEEPAVISPCFKGCEAADDFSCYGCCKIIKKSGGIECPRCKWFACCEDCLDEPWHVDYECIIFEKHGIPPTKAGLDALFFIRCLVFKEKCSEKKWDEIINLADMFEVETADSKSEIETNFPERCNLLRDQCGLKFDDDMLLKLIRIDMVNSIEINPKDNYGNEYEGKALFLVSALLTNGCSPNLHWLLLTTNGERGRRWQMTLVARKDIAVGDTLSIAYLPEALKYSTQKRRLMIRNRLNFNCRCNRCKDGSELGTNFSGVMCKSCGDVMSPAEPLNFETRWSCVACFREVSNKFVRKWITKFKRSLMAISKNVDKEEGRLQLDALIRCCGSKYHLHENNSHVIIATIIWLRKVNLNILLETSDFVDNLYHTVLYRAQNCAAVVSAIGQYQYLALCEDATVEAMIKYNFKSKDCRSIEVNNCRLEKTIGILKSIQEHALEGIKALQLTSDFRGKILSELKERHAYYGEKLRETQLLAGITDYHSVTKEEAAA